MNKAYEIKAQTTRKQISITTELALNNDILRKLLVTDQEGVNVNIDLENPAPFRLTTTMVERKAFWGGFFDGRLSFPNRLNHVEKEKLHRRRLHNAWDPGSILDPGSIFFL